MIMFSRVVSEPQMRKRRLTRRGFIILFGWRSIVSTRPEPPVMTVCPACRQKSSLVPMQARDWFTLFFIPVFPVSGKKLFIQCQTCQAAFEGDVEALRRAEAEMDSQARQQSIALYNTLRTSPKDSALLNQLLETYAAMQDWGEALAAGRHFPEALMESAQCLTTYGKINMAAGNQPEALKYFGMALGKNPALAEAHFYTAISYLSMNPPNVEAAIAAARQAQIHGHPEAGEVIKQAEGLRAGK
jgi:tetratricopeptide (TPR) repeat protein